VFPYTSYKVPSLVFDNRAVFIRSPYPRIGGGREDIAMGRTPSIRNNMFQICGSEENRLASIPDYILTWLRKSIHDHDDQSEVRTKGQNLNAKVEFRFTRTPLSQSSLLRDRLFQRQQPHQESCHRSSSQQNDQSSLRGPCRGTSYRFFRFRLSQLTKPLAITDLRTRSTLTVREDAGKQ
jgi:hypothetical protein